MNKDGKAPLRLSIENWKSNVVEFLLPLQVIREIFVLKDRMRQILKGFHLHFFV